MSGAHRSPTAGGRPRANELLRNDGGLVDAPGRWGECEVQKPSLSPLSSDVLAHEVALASVNLPRAPARARGGRCPRTPCRRPHAGSSRSTLRAARMARTRVEMKQYLRTIGPWAGSPSK